MLVPLHSRLPIPYSLLGQADRLVGLSGSSERLPSGFSSLVISLFCCAALSLKKVNQEGDPDEWLPFPKGWRDLIGLVRWPILAVLLILALGTIYRFAPARRHPCWHLFSLGTIAAATLWLAGSAAFSYYVANFSSYDKTYGSLGTVVVLLMWLYLSSFIVLVGAELNFEIERSRPDKAQCPEPEPQGARGS